VRVPFPLPLTLLCFFFKPSAEEVFPPPSGLSLFGFSLGPLFALERSSLSMLFPPLPSRRLSSIARAESLSPSHLPPNAFAPPLRRKNLEFSLFKAHRTRVFFFFYRPCSFPPWKAPLFLFVLPTARSKQLFLSLSPPFLPTIRPYVRHVFLGREAW